MNLVRHPWPGAGAATRLWLMLPGAYMAPPDFVRHGVVDAVHGRGLPHDIAVLDANIAQVADGSALARLQQVLAEEAPPGVAVWLLGISLGAHLAMSCLARASAGDLPARAAARVAGAVLLAPYLGPRDAWGEVAAAGLHGWQAPAGLEHDVDRQIWRWLQQGGTPGCALHLGYGADDRFAAAHALMAQALPPTHVDVQPGGHDWPVWTRLWDRHLERAHGG